MGNISNIFLLLFVRNKSNLWNKGKMFKSTFFHIFIILEFCASRDKVMDDLLQDENKLRRYLPF